MNNVTHIKSMMRQSAKNGRARIGIGITALGESTVITIKGKDFRAETVAFTNEEVFIEGYYEDKDILQSIRLSSVDETSLPELEWSLGEAIHKEKNKTLRVKDFFILPNREGITDSLLLESGQEIIAGKYKGLTVSIRVNGDVRIVWKGTAYRNVGQFPDDLIKVIREHELDHHKDAYVDMNNWYEAFVDDEKGKNICYDVVDLDLSTITEKEAKELIIEQAESAIENYLNNEENKCDTLRQKLGTIKEKILASIIEFMKTNEIEEVEAIGLCDGGSPLISETVSGESDYMSVDRVKLIHKKIWDGFHRHDEEPADKDTIVVDASSENANASWNGDDLSADTLLSIYEWICENKEEILECKESES